jgi:Flp pilus assembly protein TadD
MTKMAAQTHPDQCPDDRLAEAIAKMQFDETGGLAVASKLSDEYPADPRLHFLKGSILAGLGKYGDARSEMKEALRIAPDYEIARFQLGLLELSSGDRVAAEAEWNHLDRLPARNPLRVLAGGLRYLAHDSFPEAIDELERGIVLNTQHPNVNADMRLLIDGAKKVLASGSGEADDTSATHMLLKQYAAKPTKH